MPFSFNLNNFKQTKRVAYSRRDEGKMETGALKIFLAYTASKQGRKYINAAVSETIHYDVHAVCLLCISVFLFSVLSLLLC